MNLLFYRRTEAIKYIGHSAPLFYKNTFGIHIQNWTGWWAGPSGLLIYTVWWAGRILSVSLGFFHLSSYLCNIFNNSQSGINMTINSNWSVAQWQSTRLASSRLQVCSPMLKSTTQFHCTQKRSPQMCKQEHSGYNFGDHKPGWVTENGFRQ